MVNLISHPTYTNHEAFFVLSPFHSKIPSSSFYPLHLPPPYNLNRTPHKDTSLSTHRISTTLLSPPVRQKRPFIETALTRMCNNNHRQPRCNNNEHRSAVLSSSDAEGVEFACCCEAGVVNGVIPAIDGPFACV